PQPVDSWV
nr:Chain B, Polypeptide [synthetic construct]3CH8_P Chain P, C-terminal octapeptide from protein ARVCF [synthetic construct]